MSMGKPRFKLTMVSLMSERTGRHVFFLYLPLTEEGKPYMTLQQREGMLTKANVREGERVSFN